MHRFREIWLVDFEFQAVAGECPVPVCLVAFEMRQRRLLRLWQDQFERRPPYPITSDSLFVAYYASAELGCHLALDWPMPARILDLFVEFRTQYGLDGIGAGEKEEMRTLIMRGGPWSHAEREAILDYCESDVMALARLFPVMLPRIDLPRALYRGRYMAAVARMEAEGVPINTDLLADLRGNWAQIQTGLIADIDANP